MGSQHCRIDFLLLRRVIIEVRTSNQAIFEVRTSISCFSPDFVGNIVMTRISTVSAAAS
jgi:hypothetical protein